MIAVLILFALLIYILYIAFIKAKQKRLNSNSNKKEKRNTEDIMWVDDFHLFPEGDVDQLSHHDDNLAGISHHDFSRDNNMGSMDIDNNHTSH